MTFPYKWFLSPFASAGTVAAIPNAPPGDGSISYQSGWGADYALDPATNPSALDVDRATTNQLMLDITTALQWIQTGQLAYWIDSTTNGGTAYAYAKNIILLYTDGNIWQSLIATNTAAPGSDPTKWQQVGAIGIQNQAGNYAADTGAANVYVVTLNPPLAAYGSGVPVRFAPANANTGAATVNVNGLGAKSIVHTDGSVLVAGDIPTGGLVEVIYQPTIGKFILNALPRTLPTYTVVTASGTYNPPTGCRQIDVAFCGAGGGGGTGDGGSGGSSGTGTAGGPGGDTIFNGIHAAGASGGTAGLTSGNTYGGKGGRNGTGSTGVVLRIPGGGGGPGQYGTTTGNQSGMGGAGGDSTLGGGMPAGYDAQGMGINDVGYGGGGGGGETGQSGSFSGGGGGGGETVRYLLNSPGAIAVTIGAAGTGGIHSGNFAGGNGGPGVALVKENY